MKAARLGLAAWAAVAGLAAGVAHAADIRLYSYDPADADTRLAAGPLTFTFKKGLLSNTVLNVRSTVASATAALRHADDSVLGRGGLNGAIGAGAIGTRASERDLYRVDTADQGEALIAAFCPGAGRAWMAFGPLKLNRDLKILVIGAPARGGQAKLCRTLRFTFHGEWILPPDRVIDPKSVQPPVRYPGAE